MTLIIDPDCVTENAQLVYESDTDIVPVNQNDEMTIRTFTETVQSVMTRAQFEILSGRTPKNVIQHRKGKGGKTFAYVPHGYVTKKLNEAFGFDWDFEILQDGQGNWFTVMPETSVKGSSGKPIPRAESFIVVGRLIVRLHSPNDPSVILATITKTCTGEKECVPGMTWGAHIKSAEADALKKCAARLGVALDLYWADAEQDLLDNPQPPTPTLTPEQLEEARTRYADGMSPSRAAEWLTGILGKEITRGDVGQILPELYG